MARDEVIGFSNDELEYYSRQIVLDEIGVNGQRRLKEAKVCVVGLGGLGSPISIQLASIGVGCIRLVDRDVVEMSNLQRQHLYGVNMVGYPKVEAAAERLNQINPFIEVEPWPISITPYNAEKIVEGMDVVVDGLDRMAPRYSINRACIRHSIPYVFGAVITNFGNVSTILPSETACIECFQGNLDDETLPTCATVGVHPSIINIIASIQVSEAVRIILGKKPNLANTLLFCDLKNLSFERIKLARTSGCLVCGDNPKPLPIKYESVEEICGREGRRVYMFSPEDEYEVDFGLLNKHLKKQGFKLLVKAELGTTFSKESNIKGAILKSGATILEGVDGKTEAVELYNKLRKLWETE